MTDNLWYCTWRLGVAVKLFIIIDLFRTSIISSISVVLYNKVQSRYSCVTALPYLHVTSVLPYCQKIH